MKEFKIEGCNKFTKYGNTIVTASSYKAALKKFVKENSIEEDLVEMTSKWIDINLPGVYGLELIGYADIIVKDMSTFLMMEKWYIVNKPEYKSETTCKDFVCKDANGYNLRTNSEVMCHIEENGEIHEYQGYVAETLPDNKIKINAEDRTIIVNANDCYTLECEF